MSWNYRVVRKVYTQDNATYDTFGIHEVYYDADGEPSSCTEEPIRLDACSEYELISTYEYIRRAFGKPTLEYDIFGDENENKNDI